MFCFRKIVFSNNTVQKFSFWTLKWKVEKWQMRHHVWSVRFSIIYNIYDTFIFYWHPSRNFATKLNFSIWLYQISCAIHLKKTRIYRYCTKVDQLIIKNDNVWKKKENSNNFYLGTETPLALKCFIISLLNLLSTKDDKYKNHKQSKRKKKQLTNRNITTRLFLL